MRLPVMGTGIRGSSTALLLTLLAFAGTAIASPPVPTTADEAFKDEVVSIEKDRERKQPPVEIVEDTYKRLAWKTRPKSSPVIRTRDRIVSYRYADEPSYYTRGLDAFRGGRWEEAAQEFRGALSAVDAGRAREWVKKHGTVYIADCRRRLAMVAANPARFQEAADTYEKALKLDPKSPMLDRIHLGMAESLSGAGKHDDALRQCDALMKIARADKLPIWEASARMLRGRILEDRGETGAAAQ
ncbi:MAG: tetratricopeptide repeat protein, partial [Planctomycetota bacterium]